ncbi:DUF4365 domain-containing protein [Anabaena cylindrica FACHB-243]|uniref:DUF4365 domain-containing protein n=1 Tax=Anabaena cylindrica (strain ATCC 27899 / PCC 7122) TaxID=272123 RepID=K9ZGN3_ANACC|nr:MULTISPECIES: DUF4365 domain-containing protein [Anabaena]AFZ58393.1 hypothetical protein Anacy_2973 [Anabaena cylindrica PCC 7122]MBD2416990.1 DUF4365 domain-containing protein [Anabaena cylindrica FACHB-243]MBY5280205.1 DUF4365 domain-containing protein [Anabaena sp. CCAP 1446/1C]MBY5309352.1 DUF4365 domain-containing protein [Anabaena sp. CCAP 1446/1C]MCM2406526.1 DUF4365 domain-containing protein [Anabaena sp. CCAP 1446/1C]
MQTEQAWYIGLRSKALTVVYLTRRDDLIVDTEKKEHDLDILVSIRQNGKNINRIFGVEVKAIKSSPKIIQNNHIFNIEGADINVLQSRFIKCNFPICLFFFTLDNDNGYYKWINEPILDNENSNKLKSNGSPEFRKLTNEAINDIVSLVNQWYENQTTNYVISRRERYHVRDALKQITQKRAAKDDINQEVNDVKS